jgi:predicted secreted protein|tara:strand:- start:294 stop:560 length:267 start_codon:yes stop_codon:yes gene_type:complete
MKIFKVVIISFLLFLFSFSSYAHDDEPLLNQMNLQAQAEREIPNEQLTVMLAIEEEGKEAAKIANKINQDMDWALKIVVKKSGVNSSM